MAEPEHTNIVDAIMDLKRRDPFVPFSIVMTSGDKYRIESGENLVEMRTEFFYASPRTGRFVFIRKNQIVSLEHSEERRRPRRKAS